jgi:hypothetical protein
MIIEENEFPLKFILPLWGSRPENPFGIEGSLVEGQE